MWGTREGSVSLWHPTLMRTTVYCLAILEGSIQEAHTSSSTKLCMLKYHMRTHFHSAYSSWIPPKGRILICKALQFVSRFANDSLICIFTIVWWFTGWVSGQPALFYACSTRSSVNAGMCAAVNPLLQMSHSKLHTHSQLHPLRKWHAGVRGGGHGTGLNAVPSLHLALTINPPLLTT